MGYRILEFQLGTGCAQGYVLEGTGDHEGTRETISVADMMAHGTDGPSLARFLDFRFLRAHGERVGHDLEVDGRSTG